MARDVIIATFENRNQAYEAARDIDKLDDSVIDVQSWRDRREGHARQRHLAGLERTSRVRGAPSAAPPAAPSSGRWSARSPARPAP